MNAYEALAFSYDALTYDVPYEKIAAYFETLLRRSGVEAQTVLDLACGTGSLSVLLAARGFRVLGVDCSEEMLTVASEKAAELALETPPFFILQKMQRLRLPEPVDAAICSLDSVNYVTRPADLQKAFARVCAALSPGGLFVFDINTPLKLRGLDGQVFLDENDESYCVWRAEFDEEENCCYYGIDLFRRRGALWARSFEQHCEYAYDPDTLEQWLREAGFARVECFGDRTLTPPGPDEQRMYFAAWKE